MSVCLISGVNLGQLVKVVFAWFLHCGYVIFSLKLINYGNTFETVNILFLIKPFLILASIDDFLFILPYYLTSYEEELSLLSCLFDH